MILNSLIVVGRANWSSSHSLALAVGRHDVAASPSTAAAAPPSGADDDADAVASSARFGVLQASPRFFTRQSTNFDRFSYSGSITRMRTSPGER